MTKEQAIEVLRRNTNLGYGIVIENESIQLIKEAIEMAIKALEKQPCDDCENNDGECCRLLFEKSFNKDCVPTHGTCKDCKQLGVMDCGYYCKLNHWGKISTKSNYGGMGDFYCGDFEKRGNENEIN